MASDTAPAVPGPAEPPHPATTPDPAGTPGMPARPAQGWLAAALQPVDPARPTFDLNPADSGSLVPDGGFDPHTTPGASSAAFHDGDDPTRPGGKNSGQEKGIWRAWLLAGAERWRKGADARNKMLDIKKAKAQAHQQKVTVNRSEKIVGGSTNAATSGRTDAGKSLSNKSANSGTGGRGGAKNASSGGRSGPGGRSGASGHGGSGHGGHKNAGSGTGGGRGTHRNDTSGSGKGGKTDHGKPNNGGVGKSGSGSGGKAGKDGASGNGGASGKAGKDTKAQSNGSVGKTPKAQTTTTCGDASGISMTKDNKPKKTPDTPGTSADTSVKKTAKGPAGAPGNPGKTPAPAPARQNKPVDLGKKNPDTKGGDKTTPKTAPGPDGKDPKKTPGTPDPKTTPTPAGGPAVNTQPSREAGYRDGVRIGKAEAHVKAYRDGVRDGRTDTRKAADREKARLDQAHAQRQQPRPPAVPPKPTMPPKPAVPPTTPDPRTILTKPKEQPMPTASSADYHPPHTQAGGQAGQKATPIKVDSIDGSHLRLGDGAAVTTISRGEVRTLKQYQRRLTPKADRMGRIAEATKALQAHAAEQAKEITDLREQAKAVKAVDGGDDLIAELARLEEAATAQIERAAEIHKRAVRGADNTRALLANVETRYGGMYKAVVDSPLTAPAEMRYYTEGSHA